MRAVLIQPASPPTYWGHQHSLSFIDKGAILPPLGLATLAAHLPATWELRVRDLHLAPLDDADLRWADAVLVTGMLVQAGSIREVLSRARALGRPSVLGGPAATTSPEAFPEATHLFRGEAEGRLGVLVAALEAGTGPRDLTPAGEERPDLALCRVPRFDLLALDRYATYAIQVSRGCPFRCEFCDIIEIFGRSPRVKAPAQVLAELEALRRLGARGPLFIVDDNFIGNRRAAARLLPELAAWQRASGTPFDLYTEASLDLATEDALAAAMVDAGFSAVFVGLETPDPDTLARTGKRQNLRIDPAAAIEKLTRAGLEVFAGFIVGFDGDDAAALERQRAFVAALPIPRAMVGVLTALPGTQLWRRLEREGRLRSATTGDQFDRPNFETTMGDEALVAGYRALLAGLFSPEAYFDRCARHLALSPPRSGSFRPGTLAALRRAIWRLGIVGPRRRYFWRLVGLGLRRGPGALPRAITLAIIGEHFIRYTEEEVLPRLDRRLAEIRAERRAAPSPPEHATARQPARPVLAPPHRAGPEGLPVIALRAGEP
ncbi:B12-binding domain-containing radical SAM protein [Anaeromyxobacter oryzisoli]|uniref:B12-binding domain-containing radical SAM protein n=1 Tax=Anaeromyxobacter oryzisoli TaxID=2925408 RepID=UPI001F594B21|nr:B12-binding domain-containing radical SAM protein [Anaeromyxobacter sp. SG63]